MQFYMLQINFKTQMSASSFLLVTLVVSALGVQFLKTNDNPTAHGDMIITASIFNDNSKFVTGSDDNTVKIWSMADHSLITTLIYGDVIQNVGLHPVTNQLFVLVFDGTISVVDPTTLLETTSFYHPTGNANYIVFDIVADIFILVGYDGAAVSPCYHVYDLNSLAFIRTISVSNFPIDDQIYVCSLSRNGTQLAMINSGIPTSQYIVIVYDLTTDTEIFYRDSNTNTMKWVLFSPFINGQFFTTSADNTVQMFESGGPANYTLVQSFDISAIGSPNCLNTLIEDHLVVSADDQIVLYYLNRSSPSVLRQRIRLPQLANVFVFDFNNDLDQMVVGMENGEMSNYEVYWSYGSEDEDKQTKSKRGLNQSAMIGIIVGVIAFVILLVIIFVAWKFKCCKSLRIGSKKQNKEEDVSSHTLENKNKTDARLLKDKMHKNKMQIITVPPFLKKKKNKKDDSSDDESEDLDYDQLMAHGTIIVIKDDDKKKQYIKKLKKQHKKHKKQHKNEDLKLMEDNSSDKSSDIGWDDLVKGNIIIIRDDDNPKKRDKKHKKKDQQDSDLSSNPDYDMLMAEGNVIIIADDDAKKKYINQLKKQKEHKKKDNMSEVSSDIDYDMLMAEQNIIIIKDDDSKKKYLKNIKKDKDLKEIKHDQVQANGTILVIKDEEKKRDLINNIKKKENKKDTPLDKEKEKSLMAAEHIIVIRENDNTDDSDDQSEPDYEQLIAEGTVIVIKDDDTIKKYNKFVQQEKKKEKINKKNNKMQQQHDSDGSEEPDMQALYVQGHVIIISDDKEKKMYTDFMKKNKKKAKNVSEKSSDVDYDELMRDANAIAIKDVDMNKIKNLVEEKKEVIDSDQQGDRHMMAQGNVIVIGGEDSNVQGLLAEDNVIQIGGDSPNTQV